MAGADADELTRQLADNWREATLTGEDRSLLEYAERLTRQPSSISAEHIQSLRNAGWDDRGIHDLCAIVSYFAFANRIANGLGIEVES